MPDDKAFDDFFNFRVHSVTKARFIEKCKEIGTDHTDLMREMIAAVLENRLKIKIDEHPKLQEIYHVD